MSEDDVSLAVPCSLLEKAGLVVLDWLDRPVDRSAEASLLQESVFDRSDAQLRLEVMHVAIVGILLSSFVSVLYVYPSVAIDLAFQSSPVYIHVPILLGSTALLLPIELLLLFFIALRCSQQLGRLLLMLPCPSDPQNSLSVRRLLVRAALELGDPDVQLLGVDPFARLSRLNLAAIALVYKLKIVISNLVIKFLLRLILQGDYFGAVPIAVIAFPVEIFWNALVVHHVVQEARLRLFGHILIKRIKSDLILSTSQMSPKGKETTLRAAGCAVVLAQHHHSNMLILFLSLLPIMQPDPIPNDLSHFGKLKDSLKSLPLSESAFVCDVLCVAASFDGRVSFLESTALSELFSPDEERYLLRMHLLVAALRAGQLHRSLALTTLDFERG